jgi:hypothetical protein
MQVCILFTKPSPFFRFILLVTVFLALLALTCRISRVSQESILHTFYSVIAFATHSIWYARLATESLYAGLAAESALRQCYITT